MIQDKLNKEIESLKEQIKTLKYIISVLSPDKNVAFDSLEIGNVLKSKDGKVLVIKEHYTVDGKMVYRLSEKYYNAKLDRNTAEMNKEDYYLYFMFLG